MKRREFLNQAILVAGTTAMSPWLGTAQTQLRGDESAVKRVFAIFKCHLDVGFTDTQANVMRLYFDKYFPQALEISATLRATGGDQYVWTTGSWLLYEYLEQADGESRKKMEDGILAGDIAWHALPFNWQTEMLDRSMIEGCLGFSASLDKRFGRKTIGAKMTDVPGHSRGIINPLVTAGVKLLDIGVNPASTPPDVPEAFLWNDLDGSLINHGLSSSRLRRHHSHSAHRSGHRRKHAGG